MKMKIIFLLLIILNINFCLANDVREKDFNNSVPMELLPNFQNDFLGAEYKEDRGLEYINFLAPSAKVTVPGGSGSGTIVYYDEIEGYAYVATCGHLWKPGILTSEQAKIKKLKCYLTFWYNNKNKLDVPQKYEAEVLFYGYVKGCDTALVRFRPDYAPIYFRMGPSNYIYLKGEKVHSMGCDGAREVAHYDMEIIGEIGKNLIAIGNSPRPGRSGGGLVDKNGYYIGTCWGTTSVNGDGEGYFTPLKTIYSFWESNGYGNILLNKDAQKIKIYDRLNRKFLENGEVIIPILNL
jgi:hypothetical protein